MCVLSDCVVRIETGLWVIHLHYLCDKACVQNVVEYLTTVEWTTRPQGVACRGHWPLGTSSAHCTVHSLPYRLRHSLTNQSVVQL